MKRLKFKKVILQGTSFGGCVAPFVDKYKKTNIKDIVLVSAVTNWVTQNEPYYKGSESVAEFDNKMKFGMKNIWRGYADSEWPQIIKGKMPEYNPLGSTQQLKGKRVFIYHGNKDSSVNWKDSKVFYDKLQAEGLVESVYWKLFLNHGHTSALSTAATIDALTVILKSKSRT